MINNTRPVCQFCGHPAKEVYAGFPSCLLACNDCARKVPTELGVPVHHFYKVSSFEDEDAGDFSGFRCWRCKEVRAAPSHHYEVVELGRCPALRPGELS